MVVKTALKMVEMRAEKMAEEMVEKMDPQKENYLVVMTAD